MHIHSDEEIMHFKTGEFVKAIGKPQVLKIIECRAAMPHIHIEGGKSVHYKCEWRRPNGQITSQWFEAKKLEKL